MKDYVDLIEQTVDKHRLYTTVKEVSSYHRIQATPGYREAANYMLSSLNKQGIEAKIVNYEANPEVWCLQSKMFKEWDFKEAYIELEEPHMILADVLGNPTSIVQRSYPCDFRDGRELIYLHKGSNPEDYDEKELKDKIIFIREDFHAYTWALKKGAIGFITDFIREVPGVRTRYDLYESLNYTSFWWTHTPDEIPAFGFVLTPKMGDQLAQLCLKAQKPLIVRGKVDTRLYNGNIEIVEAVLPGESDEEVILTSHLCHPKCSCNDNASGVAATTEALRTLKYLIDTGKLPKNKRTIKVLLIPEFTGTFAYLSDHTNYKKMMGAMNLDMVGAKQTRFYGPITLTDLPYSTPSFISALSELSLNLAGKEVYNLANEKVSKTNYTTEPYSGGSDHTVYSDPAIDIPCCMLGQWPDLNYHTSTDTIDVIDPEVLAFSCRTGALFAYTLSNLNMEDVKEIQIKAHEQFTKKLNKAISYEECEHIKQFFIDSVKDYKRFMSIDETFIEKETAYYDCVCKAHESYNDFIPKEKIDNDYRVYKRLFTGPFQRIEDNIAAHPEFKGAYEKYRAVAESLGMAPHDDTPTLVLFYTDGIRTIDEVSELVECDTHHNYKKLIEAYYELLMNMNMLEQVR